MKTLAVVLFSLLSFTACATDEGAIETLDKPVIDDRKDLDTTLEGEVADWAQDQVSGSGGHLSGMLHGPVRDWALQQVDGRKQVENLGGTIAEWAEEILIDNKQYTLIHGLRGEVQLLDFGTIIVTGRLSRGLPEK